MPTRTLEETLLDRERNNYPEEDPQGSMQLALEQLRSVMPKEVASVKKIKPFNWIDKLLGMEGKARAYTTPFTHNISYDPNVLLKNQAYNTALMAHELTHIKQFNEQNPLEILSSMWDQISKPHDKRIIEIEASIPYNSRRNRLTDINLPTEEVPVMDPVSKVYFDNIGRVSRQGKDGLWGNERNVDDTIRFLVNDRYNTVTKKR